ncbi:Endonuclease/exonuclease/phosphatase superfamily [Sesbania bispinosa]|nr:Endonuclease/exonuclease/phosphatase superfamily [Sesbania bispinosa]
MIVWSGEIRLHKVEGNHHNNDFGELMGEQIKGFVVSNSLGTMEEMLKEGHVCFKARSLAHNGLSVGCLWSEGFVAAEAISLAHNGSRAECIRPDCIAAPKAHLLTHNGISADCVWIDSVAPHCLEKATLGCDVGLIEEGPSVDHGEGVYGCIVDELQNNKINSDTREASNMRWSQKQIRKIVAQFSGEARASKDAFDHDKLLGSHNLGVKKKRGRPRRQVRCSERDLGMEHCNNEKEILHKLAEMEVRDRESKLNDEGARGRLKKVELLNLVKSEKADLLCVQETKMQEIDRKLCGSLWDDDKFDWASSSSEGRSGGLLTIWMASMFKV